MSCKSLYGMADINGQNYKGRAPCRSQPASRAIPIKKKSALRADAPEWKAPSAWEAPEVAKNKVQAPETNNFQYPKHQSTGTNGLQYSACRTTGPKSTPATPERPHMGVEEQLLAMSESKRVWNAVRQAQGDTATRRVWGANEIVREPPRLFIEKAEGVLHVTDEDFPVLPGNPSTTTTPAAWPGNPHSSVSVHDETTCRLNMTIDPVPEEGLTALLTTKLKLDDEDITRSRASNSVMSCVTVTDTASEETGVPGANQIERQITMTATAPVIQQDSNAAVAEAEFKRATLLPLANAEPDRTLSLVNVPNEGPLLQVSGDVFTAPAFISKRDNKPSAHDFDIIRSVGEGSFGRVMLIERKTTKERFAMKILTKDRVLARENQRHVMEERDILTRVEHPFIVSLVLAFQTRSKLFLIMEYLPGGELLKKIQKEGLLKEKEAMFYAGEMVLALEYLHSKNIVHRDLKPENVLLDSDGHIRLTDFGLARKLDGEEAMLKSICGTDLYMAPEMLAGNAYGKAVDFWALGCVLFEMQTGDPPFDAMNRKRLYQIIMTKNPRFPSWMSSTCTKFLKGLLDRNVEKRLGAARSTMFEVGGVAAVKQHEFFKKLDWVMLEKKLLTPPLKPDLDAETDPTNTNPDDFHDGGGSECSSEDFRGFSYVHPRFAFSPQPGSGILAFLPPG